MFPSTALATPYGSGSYGNCEFEDGCAATTTGGGSTTTTPTNNSSTDEDTETADSGSTVVLNTFEDFFSSNGKDIADIQISDKVEFCIEAATVFEVCDFTKLTHHTATLKSLDLTTGTAVITIASTPTDYTLSLDTPLKIDIDKDDTDDIEVTLTDMSATTADINFRSLKASTPTTTTDTKEDSPKNVESSSISWLWWLLGTVGLLALLAIIIAIFRKKTGKDDNGSSFGSGPMGAN